MLIEVKRFHRQARTLLRDASADRLTLGDFLEQGGYSDYFHDHFILPLTGAIWSCAPGQIRSFPARYLIRFFANHGMLTVKHAPTLEDCRRAAAMCTSTQSSIGWARRLARRPWWPSSAIRRGSP